MSGVLHAFDGDYKMVDNALVKADTGEIVARLEDVDHEVLVAALLRVREAEQTFKDARTAIEDELVRRHGDRRAAQVVGDHEVDVDRGFSRVWDPEDLLEVVSDLVGRGLLTVMDAQGLVRDEPKVDGRAAAKLLNRVDGEALTELRRCFTWETRGRARVKVTPVASLEEEIS